MEASYCATGRAAARDVPRAGGLAEHAGPSDRAIEIEALPSWAGRLSVVNPSTMRPHASPSLQPPLRGNSKLLFSFTLPIPPHSLPTPLHILSLQNPILHSFRPRLRPSLPHCCLPADSPKSCSSPHPPPLRLPSSRSHVPSLPPTTTLLTPCRSGPHTFPKPTCTLVVCQPRGPHANRSVRNAGDRKPCR
jgi:hypothetical protein